ncbi:MAG: DUF502 domain-containing protein [Planctomycetota bacterium]
MNEQAGTEKRKTFVEDFRTFFLRGLGILLPSIVTLGILVWAYTFLSENVAGPLNAGVRSATIYTVPRVMNDESLPGWFVISESELATERAERQREGRRELPDEALVRQMRADALADYWKDHWYLEGIGFFVAIVLVYLAGVLLGNLIGRRIYQKLEAFFTRIPVIKQLYPSVKQITDFLLSPEEKRTALPSNRVVLVEYPRVGIWTIGLMTGESMRAINSVVGSECVTVFIPSSPTPFTGYTLNVRKDDVVELPISLDEALRFVVSGGVLVPEHQSPSAAGIDAVELPEAEPTSDAPRGTGYTERDA